jgi:hypothetical protein
MVGSGDCAALIDHIEVLESEPTQVPADAKPGVALPEVVRQFRNRVAQQPTGKPLAVRLDRRLFSPANARRRKQVEDRIRGMHGTKLYDGRFLHVDEVLGRYDKSLGGTAQQLSEVQERLNQGQPVRLAVSPRILSDDLYRLLGILSDRYGGQLSLSLDRDSANTRSFYDRLAIEASLAHVGDIRERLASGERLVLRVEPATLTAQLRQRIKSLQREFAGQLRVEGKRFRGQAEVTSVTDGRGPRESAAIEDHETERAEIPFTELPDSPPPGEDRTSWAREVAARVRRPWWQRIGRPRKAKGGLEAAE